MALVPPCVIITASFPKLQEPWWEWESSAFKLLCTLHGLCLWNLVCVCVCARKRSEGEMFYLCVCVLVLLHMCGHPCDISVATFDLFFSMVNLHHASIKNSKPLSHWLSLCLSKAGQYRWDVTLGLRMYALSKVPVKILQPTKHIFEWRHCISNGDWRLVVKLDYEAQLWTLWRANDRPFQSLWSGDQR